MVAEALRRSLLTRLLGPAPRLDTADDLAAFMARHASLVAQKATIEYCRLKAGGHWDKLLREPPFAKALERARWDAFAAVLTDVLVIAEGKLRDPAGPSTRLADRLAALGGAILAGHPAPAHRPGGWDAIRAAMRERLAQAQLAAPKPIATASAPAGRAVFDALPIHPSLRGHDRELIARNVAFNLCRFVEDLERRADLAGLRRAVEA